MITVGAGIVKGGRPPSLTGMQAGAKLAAVFRQLDYDFRRVDME